MELFNKSFTKVVNLKVFFINPGKVLPKLSASSKENKASELDAEDVVLDDEDVDVDLGDDLLEEDDEDDNVPLEEIADMPSEDDS